MTERMFQRILLLLLLKSRKGILPRKVEEGMLVFRREGITYTCLTFITFCNEFKVNSVPGKRNRGETRFRAAAFLIYRSLMYENEVEFGNVQIIMN